MDKEKLKKTIQELKQKCDGENGCGYDGSQEDRQYLCGGPIVMNGPQIHDTIRIYNKAIEDVLSNLDEVI